MGIGVTARISSSKTFLRPKSALSLPGKRTYDRQKTEISRRQGIQNLRSLYIIVRNARIKNKKRVSPKCGKTLFCRKEETRTPDPYVPNVVRYQLRYFPMQTEHLCSFAAAKVQKKWETSIKCKENCDFYSNFLARFRKSIYLCTRNHEMMVS